MTATRKARAGTLEARRKGRQVSPASREAAAIETSNGQSEGAHRAIRRSTDVIDADAKNTIFEFGTVGRDENR